MIEVIRDRPGTSSGIEVAVFYQVTMPCPETHLFEVSLRVAHWTQSILDLKLPVWTPGSYLVREYARHLQDFSARTPDGQMLAWHKQCKNHWQVETDSCSEVEVFYRIYANELSVRTNHLDTTHGYWNGAALFCYIPGLEKKPLRVTAIPPCPEWVVTTSLPVVPSQPNTFQAEDYDMLVDSPFEVGCHSLYQFEVHGKSHELAIWGKGNVDPQQLIRDIQKVIAVEAEIFGELPYERYVFLLHLSSQGFGGLEHKYSCSLNYPRFNFRSKDKYYRFVSLVAHEFFHLWNVKRIRPKALEVFDYDRENYTPSLWFSEGATSYYDSVIPFRCGVYDAKVLLESLGKEINRFLNALGRQIQPLSESSFDAWIKLYRPNENSGNSQISYYLKGELVTFLLDLHIRAGHRNRRSFDDVMRRMWRQFGQREIGFTPAQLQETIEEVAGGSLQAFFASYLHGTEELPFDEYLAPFGLKLRCDRTHISNKVPYLGLQSKTENGREVVKFVVSRSPAQQAGIDAGDEVLAIDGIRVAPGQLRDRIQDYRSGDTIQMAVFHQDQLRICSVTLAEPRCDRYQIVAVDNPSPAQEDNFQGWLGVSLTAIQ